MKILTNFKTTITGNKAIIEADIVDGRSPFPSMQNTAMHVDDNNPRHITHCQLSNHGYFVKTPNKDISVGIPNEEWIMNVARIVEPKLCPPEPAKK